MNVIADSTIVGPFEGWKQESTYELADGSSWQQTSRLHKPVSAPEGLRARIFEKDDLIMMQVPGMTEEVVVQKLG